MRNKACKHEQYYLAVILDNWIIYSLNDVITMSITLTSSWAYAKFKVPNSCCFVSEILHRPRQYLRVKSHTPTKTMFMPKSRLYSFQQKKAPQMKQFRSHLLFYIEYIMHNSIIFFPVFLGLCLVKFLILILFSMRSRNIA